MTRRMAGIPKHKVPTRATRRGSVNRYCRSMKRVGTVYEDAYGKKYERHNGGLRRIA